MAKTLTREHSREYSLFRVYAWHTIMSKYVPEWFGKDMDTVALAYRGEDLVDVYYEDGFVEEIFRLVATYAYNKEKTVAGINRFYEQFEELKPYFRGERLPRDLGEFRRSYDLYVEFYAFISVIFVVPNLPDADPELKKMALEAREKTQEYNEAFEPIVKEFLEYKYPELEGKTRFILPQEVWSGEVEGPEILNRIADRERGFVFYKGELYAGNIDGHLKKLELTLSDGVDDGEKTESLSGQVAQKGIVRGRVKILTSSKNLDKVEEGDILVASMTMPKYLPAMKRAAAFVTDEGGITCHAAIVAREMKKPCIIGTKIATKVLKDGDKVEVDAAEGVVRILNR